VSDLDRDVKLISCGSYVMRTLHHIIGATLLIAAGSSIGFAQPDVMDPPSQEPAEIDCPDAMRGMKLEVQTVDGGVAIEITTPRPRNVIPMRRDLRNVASLIEQKSKDPTGIDPSARIPPISIVVQDIKSGVHVRITPQRAKDLTLLRQLAVGLQSAWEGSECARGDVEA
jgi:hypothetical protein